MSIFRLSLSDAQAILAVVALGPDALREFFEIEGDDGMRAFSLKWFGEPSPTKGSVRRTVLERLSVAAE